MIRKTFPTNENFVGLDIHLSDFVWFVGYWKCAKTLITNFFLCIIIWFCMKCEWNFYVYSLFCTEIHLSFNMLFKHQFKCKFTCHLKMHFIFKMWKCTFEIYIQSIMSIYIALGLLINIVKSTCICRYSTKCSLSTYTISEWCWHFPINCNKWIEFQSPNYLIS